MNKTLLCMAVMAASFASVASAQEFDDRWYLSGTVGQNFQDSKRATEGSTELGLGIGRFFDPNWSLDFGVYSANPGFDSNRSLNFSQYGAQVDLRRHFRDSGAKWWPYLKAGVGVQRAEEEFNAFPSPNSPDRKSVV